MLFHHILEFLGEPSVTSGCYVCEMRGVCLEIDMAILGKGGVCVCVYVKGGRGDINEELFTRSPKQMCVHLWGRG